MTHDEIVQVLEANYPAGDGNGSWNYHGDGSTFTAAAYDDQGNRVSGDVDWHRTEPIPTLVQLEQALAAVQQAAAAAAAAAAWAELRKVRDRWLSQCQVVFDEIKTAGSQDLSQPMLDGITANGAAWLAWRDAMRDLPSTIGNANDPTAALAALQAADIASTTDTFPSPWPQPPAAPVMHLT